MKLTSSRHPIIPKRQLRDVDINRVSADALEAARRRRGDGVATPELADGAPNAPNAAERMSLQSAAETPSDAPRVSASPPAANAAAAAVPRAEHSRSKTGRRSAVPVAGKWDVSLPLPPAYERLADAFVALQQVGPLLRKRQQACTADIVCASVETMTGRRCTLAMLRSVEAVQPGTVSFSVRGGGSAFDPENGPTSPRRVRADVADPDGVLPVPSKNESDEAAPLVVSETRVSNVRKQPRQQTQDAKGVSARRFRAALVALVGAHHDAFCAEEREKRAEEKADGADDAPVMADGVVVEWHARFDLGKVPDPPLEGIRGCVADGGASAAADGGRASRKKDAAATAAVALGERVITGNGSAVPDSWHRGHAKDTADVKARLVASVPVATAEAAAAAAELGDAGRELPLAAVAAVMHRKRMADHDLDPATVAERRRRRLCDLLPGTFDTVRSLFATSKKKVSPFADLLDKTTRATSKKNATRDETEAALRLVAEASPEWCALMPAHTTVSGEELFRIKTSDAAVTRFVRQKLVAMKEDKL